MRDDIMESFYRDIPIREINVEETMYNNLINSFEKHSNHIGIGYMGMDIKYLELKERLILLTNALKKLDIKEGDVVPVCMPNTPETPLILGAINAFGAATKWIDMRSTDNQLISKINAHDSKLFICFNIFMTRIEKILEKTNLHKVLYISPTDSINPLKVLFNSLSDFKGLLKEAKQAKNEPKIIIPNDDRVDSLKHFVKQNGNKNLINPVKYDKERPTLYIQSSGTTGPAKTILHTDYNANVEARKLAYFNYPFGVGHTLFVTAPCWVAYGLINSIYTSLLTGTKTEIYPRISDSMVYENRHKFDMCFAVPLHARYMYNEIFPTLNEQQKNQLRHELQKIRCFVVGGDKITAAETLQFQEEFGIDILNAWGCNEGLGGINMNPIGGNKPGSVGIPLYGDEVKIINPTTRKECLPNEMGEVYVHTESEFQEYYGDEYETKRIKEVLSDGKEYIRPGDAGYKDEDGYLFLSGRLGRSITCGGFKVFPGTIEDEVIKHPAVKDCCAVGVRDDKNGHVPMVFFTIDKNYKDTVSNIIDQINTICVENIESYKCPSYIVCIDEIPYNQSQKQEYKLLEKIGNDMIKENNIVTSKVISLNPKL